MSLRSKVKTLFSIFCPYPGASIRTGLGNFIAVALDRLITYRCLYGLRLKLQELRLPAAQPGIDVVELDPVNILNACQDPELELNLNVVRAALAKGDRCFGVIEMARIVSYAWVSLMTTDFDSGSEMTFPEGCCYIYNCFTRKESRGKRYMQQAVAHLMTVMQREAIIAIAPNNFFSLKSFQGLGSQIFGWTLYVQLFGKRYYRHSSSAKKLPFGLRDAARNQ